MVLILGAGVEGLSAIKTAKSMGSNVKAYDIRNHMREQVESLGAEFIEIKINEESDYLADYDIISERNLKEVRSGLESIVPMFDIIICCFPVTDSNSSKLISAKMVRTMRKGSVIIDLRAEHGGNCELTK